MLELDKLIHDSRIKKAKIELLVYQAIKAEKSKLLSAKNPVAYTDSVEFGIIRKMIAQHKETIEAYKAANRSSESSSEEQELAVLESLLPVEADGATLSVSVKEWCIANNLDSVPKQQMGLVIKALKAKYPSTNGKLIADVVKSFIQN